ncbi:hypothetical protein [Legionella sp. CNM-4043-24]|uniref:hypothetical protein n=1 Tax=Legionella sp. CNM-4043-24 TaxID=3421646 RepID=UPI00403B09B3
MYISLQEIQYNGKPLVWTLNLDTNTVTSDIPPEHQEVFRQIFKDKPGVGVDQNHIEIKDARQFIEQGGYSVHLVIDGQRSIPARLHELEELLGRLLIVTRNYEHALPSNQQIENRLAEAVNVMDADLLTRLCVEIDENPLIASNPAISKALKQVRDAPDFLYRPGRAAGSEEGARVEQDEIKSNLSRLAQIAQFYDPVEEAMTDFLARHPSPIFELIISIITQTDELRTPGNGIWLRLVECAMADRASSASEISQSSSNQDGSSTSTTHTSQRASPLIPSRSSSTSPRFFTPQQSKNLSLDHVMDKANLTQNEYRDTFIHETGEFLAIAKRVRVDQNNFPVHTLKSFHLLTTAVEKNIELYPLKRQLLNELKSLFDDSIDPTWRSMSSSKDDSAMQKALSDWFKGVILEVMRALPDRDETEKKWKKRRDTLMNKLAFLGSSTVSLKKLAVEKRIGETLQRLAGVIQKDKERKKRVTNNVKKIRELTSDIGKLEFQSREQISQITQEYDSEQDRILGKQLFSKMLKAIIKENWPGVDTNGIVGQANTVAIASIKRANDHFVKRLQASGLDVNDRQYDAVVKEPTMLANNYTNRFIYDKLYIAEPLLTLLQSALPAFVRESDLRTEEGVSLLVNQIDRFFEVQISGLLSRQFAQPLQMAIALKALAEAAPSSSSVVENPPEPDEESAPSGPSI